MAQQTALRMSDSQKGETTVVLVHGYMENLDIWDDLAGQLARQFRVVTLDLPGQGISQVKGAVHTMEFLADVLADVLTHQGIERCFVVGHSMGGYVAEAFAVRYPERLQGIVLFHSTPNADTPEKRANRLREIELIKADKMELIATMFAPQGFAEQNRRRMKEFIGEFEEMIILSDRAGVIAILHGLMERADQNEMMRQLRAPQLFIFGRHDDFIPVDVAQALIVAHPQAAVAWLENSGHMGFLEEPARSLEILTEFFTANS